ncbi:MAG: hypothetical protein D6733_01195, partial [Methanobacteriota archaeon]
RKGPLTPEEIESYRKELRDLMVERNLGWLNPPSSMVWTLQTQEGVVPPMGIYRNTFDRIFPELFGVEEVTIGSFARYVNALDRLAGPGGLMHITYDDPVSPTSVKIHYEMQSPGNVMMFAKVGSYMVAHSPLLLKPVKITGTQTFVDVEYAPAASEEEAYRALVSHFGQKQRLFESILKNPGQWQRLMEFIELCDGSPVVLDRQEFLGILKCEDVSGRLISLCEKILGSHISEASLNELLSALEKIGIAGGLLKKIEGNGEEIKVYYAFNDAVAARTLSSFIQETLEKAGHRLKVKRCFDDWCVFSG